MLKVLLSKKHLKTLATDAKISSTNKMKKPQIQPLLHKKMADLHIQGLLYFILVASNMTIANTVTSSFPRCLLKSGIYLKWYRSLLQQFVTVSPLMWGKILCLWQIRELFWNVSQGPNADKRQLHLYYQKQKIGFRWLMQQNKNFCSDFLKHFFSCFSWVLHNLFRIKHHTTLLPIRTA